MCGIIGISRWILPTPQNRPQFTKNKGGNTRLAHGATVWRPVVIHPQIGYYADCENAREMVGAFSVEEIMASLSLKNITKIYPHSGDDAKKAKKAKKAGEPEKKINLKVTEEGVIAVQ